MTPATLDPLRPPEAPRADHAPTPTPAAPASDRTGAVLVHGFAAAVAMWATGYLLHLPGLAAPGGLVLAGLLACLVAAGWRAGRTAGVSVAAGAGLCAGVLNLLILGSQLVDTETRGLRAFAWIWIPGSIAASGAVMAAAAALSARRSAAPRPPGAWNARLSWVALSATLILLSIGGVVTGFEAGLAVPDWPNSYGFNMFLYPLARMTGGIYYEHSHRLFGALVGLTTLVLAVRVWRTERAPLTRWLAVFAFVLVVTQGMLGGLRVTGGTTLGTDPDVLRPSTALAVVHGVLAQLYFSALAILAAQLSAPWRTAPAEPSRGATVDRVFGGLALASIFVQLVLGALFRHLNATPVLFVHIGMAVVVLIVAGGFALRMWGAYEARPVLPTLGAALLAGLGLQLLLGLGALAVTMLEGEQAISRPLQVLVTTLHQTTGALLLAGTAALFAWHLRLVQPARSPAADLDGREPAAVRTGTRAGRTLD